MSTKLKAIIADIVQGGVVAGAVLAALLNIPGLGLALGAKDVTYLVAAVGVVNAIVAVLRPYAGAAASLVVAAKASAQARVQPRQVPGR